MTAPAGRFDTVLSAALPYLQTRQNEIHTRISKAFAERLLAVEGGRPEVVIPAIILHDIGWWRVPEDRQLLAFGPKVKDPELTKVHEREGARMAREILTDLCWPQALVDEIVGIVAGHDTRPDSRSLDESLVKDADKLFRFSAQGFPIDCARFELAPAQHLAWLEERVEAWFFTATARRLAREEVVARKQAMGES